VRCEYCARSDSFRELHKALAEKGERTGAQTAPRCGEPFQATVVTRMQPRPQSRSYTKDQLGDRRAHRAYMAMRPRSLTSHSLHANLIAPYEM
jgi:hypothetical protein